MEDLDYADDIGMLSSSHKDIQEKMDKLTTTAPHLRLKLNTAKTKLIRNNYKTDNSIAITHNDGLGEVQDFAYLGSKITTDGGATKDAMARIKKASQNFAMLKPIWKSKQLLKTKLRLYNSNVLSVLLYSSECRKLTPKLAPKLETFQNRCLWKILEVFWPTPSPMMATSLATQIKI